MTEQTNLVPKRRFKEFQNAQAWEQCKLGEVVEIKDSARIPNNLWVSKGVPYLRSSDLVTDGTLGELFISDETYQSYKDKTGAPEKDDVLFTSGGKVGVTYHKIDADPVYVQGGSILYAKTSKSSILSGIYLKAFFSSPTMTKYIEEASTGLTLKHFTLKPANAAPIFLPTVKEQNKIGDFFKKIDDTIAIHQRKLEKLKAIKSAYLSDIFPAEGEREPKRRFDGFSQAWEERKLGEMGKTFTGLSGKTKEDFGHGSGEYVTYMNVFSNPISDTSMTENVGVDSKQNKLKYGDVLFTTSSETPQEVGMSSVWLENRPNVYLNSFCFGYRTTVNVNYLFLAYLLRSNTVRKQMALLAQGISRYNISKNKVMELPVGLPDIEEQGKIGNLFKKLDETISLYQHKLRKLQNIKQAYLNEMFV